MHRITFALMGLTLSAALLAQPANADAAMLSPDFGSFEKHSDAHIRKTTYDHKNRHRIRRRDFYDHNDRPQRYGQQRLREDIQRLRRTLDRELYDYGRDRTNRRRR